MANRNPLIRAVGAAASAVVLSLLAFGTVQAFPSSNPAPLATARVEQTIKPKFHELLRHNWGPRRPSWAQCWGGSYGCQNSYDPYGQSGAYSQGSGYNTGSGYYDPSYSQGSYSQGGYSQQGQGSGYYLDGRWVSTEGQGYPSGYNSGYQGGGYQGGGYNTGSYQGPSWAWQPGQDTSSYYAPQITPSGYGPSTVTVDCAGPRGGLNNALAQVSAGGTVFVRGHGPACEDTLSIRQPVVIAGEPQAAFPVGPDAGYATIKAPPGSPCAVIGAGPRGGVEFRDVILEAQNAGRGPCIQSWDSSVALVRASIHYSGEGSAIYASGGQLFTTDSEITSQSYESAIWSEDTALVMRNTCITASATGVDARPGAAGVTLDHVTLKGANDGGPGRRASVGLLARRSRSQSGKFDLRNVQVAGFETGLLFDTGSNATVTRTRISRSRIGIANDGATLLVKDSGVEAREWGVYVYSGEATIRHTFVASVLRLPIGYDPGAVVNDEDIFYYVDRCDGYRHDRWSCKARREAPAYLVSLEYGGPHHWGWDPPF